MNRHRLLLSSSVAATSSSPLPNNVHHGRHCAPPPTLHFATCPTQQHADCHIPATPPLPGERQRRTVPPRPRSPHSPPHALASAVFLEPVRNRCRLDGGQLQIKCALKEQQRDCYHDTRSPELKRCPHRGDLVCAPPGVPPPSNANAASSSPRKATSYPTTRISTAQDANSAQSV